MMWLSLEVSLMCPHIPADSCAEVIHLRAASSAARCSVVIHKTWIAGPVGMSLALVVMQVRRAAVVCMLRLLSQAGWVIDLHARKPAGWGKPKRCAASPSRDRSFAVLPPSCPQLTATTHPPGGATALIAATLPTLPKWHGEADAIVAGACC